MSSINIFKPMSIFLQAALCNIDNFLLKEFRESWKSNPGHLGLESSMLNMVLCCPPHHEWKYFYHRSEYWMLRDGFILVQKVLFLAGLKSNPLNSVSVLISSANFLLVFFCLLIAWTRPHKKEVMMARSESPTSWLWESMLTPWPAKGSPE